MLSYQHNSIRAISHLEPLPQLTILDMYSNNIQSLQGLPRTPALRGLMLGRNYITAIDSQEVCLALIPSWTVPRPGCSLSRLSNSIVHSMLEPGNVASHVAG